MSKAIEVGNNADESGRYQAVGARARRDYSYMVTRGEGCLYLSPVVCARPCGFLWAYVCTKVGLRLYSAPAKGNSEGWGFQAAPLQKAGGFAVQQRSDGPESDGTSSEKPGDGWKPPDGTCGRLLSGVRRPSPGSRLALLIFLRPIFFVGESLLKHGAF